MYTLTEIKELAERGETGIFHNGVYTILVEDKQISVMAPSAWNPVPLWDWRAGVHPEDGWKRDK